MQNQINLFDFENIKDMSDNLKDQSERQVILKSNSSIHKIHRDVNPISDNNNNKKILIEESIQLPNIDEHQLLYGTNDIDQEYKEVHSDNFQAKDLQEEKSTSRLNNDILKQDYIDNEETRKEIKSKITNKKEEVKSYSIETFTASELLNDDIPELNWIIEDILPEGLILLVGDFKIGKTFLAIKFANEVSNGNKLWNKHDCIKGKVLYISLEEGKRRLKEKLIKLGIEENDNLIFCNKLEQIGIGNTASLKILDMWVENNNPKLIIIDSLSAIRKPNYSKTTDAFLQDYNTIKQFREIAEKNHICILIIHHTRKTKSENIFDSINGSNGLGAATDGNIILVRNRDKNKQQAELHIGLRDSESQELSLKFDDCSWECEGTIEYAKTSKVKRAIYRTLKSYPEGLSPKDIEKILKNDFPNISNENIRTNLKMMKKENKIFSPEHGKWIIYK